MLGTYCESATILRDLHVFIDNLSMNKCCYNMYLADEKTETRSYVTGPGDTESGRAGVQTQVWPQTFHSEYLCYFLSFIQ